MITRELKIGFIGGGRITNIMLKVFHRNELEFKGLSVYDPVSAKRDELSVFYPEILAADSAKELAGSADIIVLAVHPPVFAETLDEIAGMISPGKYIISLSPKFSISRIQQLLGQNLPVARVIPNAPSVIGEGYNAYAVSDSVSPQQLDILKSLFKPLGRLVAVEEHKLEAYATFTGMGPTYLWFVFHEIYQQALQCGFSDQEARTALNAMIRGASETLFQSDLSFEQVLDLIPAYPMKPNEETIKNIYAEVISALYKKLSS